MSSSQNGSGDSPFNRPNTPPSQAAPHQPNQASVTALNTSAYQQYQNTANATSYAANTQSAFEEQARDHAQYSSRVNMRANDLRASGFNPSASQVAALPRQNQYMSPTELAERVGNFNVSAPLRMPIDFMDDRSGAPRPVMYSPQQTYQLVQATDPLVERQLRHDTAEIISNELIGTNQDRDDIVRNYVGVNQAFTYDEDIPDAAFSSAIAYHHQEQVTAQAHSALGMVERFNPEVYSNAVAAAQANRRVTTRGEILAARGVSAAMEENYTTGDAINNQFFSRQSAMDVLRRHYSDEYLDEEIPIYHDENESYAVISETATDDVAVTRVRRNLAAAAGAAGVTRERLLGQGEDDAYASMAGQTAYNRAVNIFGGLGGGGGMGDDGGGGGGGGGLVPSGGGDDGGGRPSLDLSIVQGQLDTLGSDHLQRFATALADASDQLQLYTGGLPAAAGGQGGAMANTFSDPSTFFNNMQMSMTDALYDVFYNDQGQPLFAGMQQGQVAPLALPAPTESAYDEQRNRAERNRQRREDNRTAGRPDEEGVERVGFGDLAKGFVGGFLGRQSVAGDKAEVRQAAAGGGLFKMLFDKTVGVGFGVGAATDIPSAISALPGGSLLAAPFGVLDKYGRQGAAFELPALQASMARGSGFYNQSPTSTKFYEGQITKLSTQLGISPEAAANMLRDVGSGSRNAMGVGDIKNLVIRGYDPTAVSGLIGSVQGANAGGALDVLGTMGAATSLRLDASGNLTDVVKGSRKLSNAEVMAFTQGSADFAMGRRMSGFGGSTAAASRQSLGMMRAGDTSLTANLQTMGRFQGVGVGASKGITAFATGMLDMALQAYAMDAAGGDPIAAQRILEDLSADPYTMRQALASLGIDETQIDTMMLGTGGLTTRDVERSKMPPAELDLKGAKSKLGTGGTGASLKTSRALAKRSQDELERLYDGEKGTLADKFATYMAETVKFQEKVLGRIPDSKGIAKINAAVMDIYGKMNILVELNKAIVAAYGETPKSKVERRLKSMERESQEWYIKPKPSSTQGQP